MKRDFQTGNTFDAQSFSVGHSRKVWRRIEEQLPGGFMITNVSDFVDDGLIRSGMAVVKSTDDGADEKDIKVLTWAQLLAGASDIDSLGIIGFLQEDAPIIDANTKATGNIIVKGEIYAYMFGENLEDAATIAEAVKGMTQKNGLNIRVVE